MAVSGGAGFGTFQNKKKLFLALFASILLVTAIVSITVSVSRNKSSNDNSNNINAAHSIIKVSCSSTLYPELCRSTLLAAPDAETSKIKSPKDVIEKSLNLTIAAVQSNYLSIKKLISKGKRLTKREKTALNDCLELVDETLDELYIAEQDLIDYPSFKKSISKHADDLESLLSAAMTNQETCVDGFSHDRADKMVLTYIYFS